MRIQCERKQCELIRFQCTLLSQCEHAFRYRPMVQMTKLPYNLCLQASIYHDEQMAQITKFKHSHAKVCYVAIVAEKGQPRQPHRMPLTHPPTVIRQDWRPPLYAMATASVEYWQLPHYTVTVVSIKQRCLPLYAMAAAIVEQLKVAYLNNNY